MPNRPRTLSNRWTTDRSHIPLSHPSWRGEAPLAELARSLPAAEFRKRLGL